MNDEDVDAEDFESGESGEDEDEDELVEDQVVMNERMVKKQNAADIARTMGKRVCCYALRNKEAK